LGNGIYATETVRSNRKHMSTLKTDKEMVRGAHDWLSCQGMSAVKWMDNKSAILLSSYQDPRAVQEIQRRVKGSKDKSKFRAMGGVDLSDQMKSPTKLIEEAGTAFT